MQRHMQHWAHKSLDEDITNTKTTHRRNKIRTFDKYFILYKYKVWCYQNIYFKHYITFDGVISL